MWAIGREQKVAAMPTQSAVLDWVKSSQRGCPQKERHQVFVIRCHQYGCYDNAG